MEVVLEGTCSAHPGIAEEANALQDVGKEEYPVPCLSSTPVRFTRANPTEQGGVRIERAAELKRQNVAFFLRFFTSL